MADNKANNVPEGGMRIDAELVKILAELLSANDLTEIEVEDGPRKIKVKRESAVQVVSHHAGSVMAPVAAAPAPLSPELPAAPVAAAPSLVDAVKSPMVGTAFLSTEPGGKPFISVGDSVKIGDTLLIVEAMKVMNPILSTKAGTVRQLLVANAQPVEYDQPLVVID